MIEREKIVDCISHKKLHSLENFQNPLCLKLADRVQHKGVDGSV